MSILIKNIDMPEGDIFLVKIYPNGDIFHKTLLKFSEWKKAEASVVSIPAPHGRLVDADALQKDMYFLGPTDTMWQNGLWVRYKAVERLQKAAPTIIEAEE